MRRIIALIPALAAAAQAHLIAGSLLITADLMPGSGVNLRPGHAYTVTWRVDVPHNEGIDLAFSADSGRTWTTVKANLPDQAKTGSYNWTVPSTYTTKGRLRICQTEKSPKCTDADNKERPSGPAPYVLVTNGLFSIVQPSALAPDVPAPSLRNAGPGAVEADFTLPDDGPVRLSAYAADGRAAAVLLEGRYSAGSHRLSLFSERLRAHPEWKLRLESPAAPR